MLDSILLDLIPRVVGSLLTLAIFAIALIYVPPFNTWRRHCKAVRKDAKANGQTRSLQEVLKGRL